MATVVITFFLFARFYVFKMDADCIERRRDRVTSRREKRWSMNSQRLEEIVAELMKPISDIRRSFATDLSALLEEYLTEAGLHALEAGEDRETGSNGGEGVGPMVPNFAELALVLQHSASVYGRKVDFLYQHVLTVSDSLQNSTQEIAETSREEPQSPTAAAAAGVGAAASRRKRKASASGEFADIALEACGGARREAGAPRPPPTLPRMYMELEPRVLAPGDAPLLDYAGEPLGLPADFHVTWRLQDGLLVDELEGPQAGGRAALRPISLVELQAAIEAAAPPSPPPLPPPPPLFLPSPRYDSPPPEDRGEPVDASTPLPPEEEPSPPRKERKRRSDVHIDDIVCGGVNMLLSKGVRRKLRREQEFSVSGAWVLRVVQRRRARVLALRSRLRGAAPPPAVFRGFDLSETDVGGFPGWSRSEALVARSWARGCVRADADSDDDGFFEQSSLGDSDASRADDSLLHPAPHIPLCAHSLSLSGAEEAARSEGAESAWSARVAARAVAAEARGGVDVARLGAAVLGALPAPAPGEGAAAVPFARVLAAAAKEEADVSRLLLASLFLANAGNVEIIQGAALSVDSFSLRLRSADERLYRAAAAAAAAADQRLLR